MPVLRSPLLKRIIVAASFAMCLTAPAHAIGPLGAMLINYIKQALTEKVVSYAKQKAMGVAGESLAGVPGAGMLGGMLGMGGLAQRPSLPPETEAALKASGLYDTNAAPLTDAEWNEYEQSIRTMAKAAGEEAEVPDIRQMRTMMASMPQMNGMLRAQLRMFQETKSEQAKMREAYAQMSEPERQEAVVELAKSFREQPAEYQPDMMRALRSDAFGMPEDMKQRLLVELKG